MFYIFCWLVLFHESLVIINKSLHFLFVLHSKSLLELIILSKTWLEQLYHFIFIIIVGLQQVFKVSKLMIFSLQKIGWFIFFNTFDLSLDNIPTYPCELIINEVPKLLTCKMGWTCLSLWILSNKWISRGSASMWCQLMY